MQKEARPNAGGRDSRRHRGPKRFDLAVLDMLVSIACAAGPTGPLNRDCLLRAVLVLLLGFVVVFIEGKRCPILSMDAQQHRWHRGTTPGPSRQYRSSKPPLFLTRSSAGSVTSWGFMEESQALLGWQPGLWSWPMGRFGAALVRVWLFGRLSGSVVTPAPREGTGTAAPQMPTEILFQLLIPMGRSGVECFPAARAV